MAEIAERTLGKHLREGAAKQRGTPNSRFAIGNKLSNKHLQRDGDNENGERREQQCEKIDGFKVLARHSEQNSNGYTSEDQVRYLHMI